MPRGNAVAVAHGSCPGRNPGKEEIVLQVFTPKLRDLEGWVRLGGQGYLSTGVLALLRRQGAPGRAAHLFLLQAQILRQAVLLLLQHRGQHGPALALLVQQA